MSFTYTIDGFALHNPAGGFWLLDSTNFAPPISPRRVDLEIPHMHGQLPLWDDEIQAAKLALRVRVTGPDEATFRARWEHLRSLMRTGGSQPLNLRRVHGTQILTTFGQLESFEAPDFWCPVNMAQATMIFNIPSGRWTATAPSIQTLPFTGLNNTTSVTAATQSTTGISDIVVRFQATGTNSAGGWMMVEDMASSTSVSPLLSTSFNSGYLYVDVPRLTAWRNSSADAWTPEADGNTDAGAQIRTPFQGALTFTAQPGLIVGQRTSAVRTRRANTANNIAYAVRSFVTYI